MPTSTRRSARSAPTTRRCLTGIRTRAGSPRIVVLNVPNLAGLPYLAGDVAGAAAGGPADLPSRMTKTVVNPLVSSNVVVVDLMCDCAQLPAVQLFVRRAASERRRLRVHRVGSRRGDDVRVVSGAAKQLPGDDDCAVTAAAALVLVDAVHGCRHTSSRTRSTRELPGAAAQAHLAPIPRRQWPDGFSPERMRMRRACCSCSRPTTENAQAAQTGSQEDSAHILLTVRADTLGRHGGQVSLPGGVVDAGRNVRAGGAARSARGSRPVDGPRPRPRRADAARHSGQRLPPSPDRRGQRTAAAVDARRTARWRAFSRPASTS